VPFDGWGKLFGDEVLASSILDRLLHQSHSFAINGPSYRLKDKLGSRSTPLAQDGTS
jgi:DNA replication protein DnaC